MTTEGDSIRVDGGGFHPPLPTSHIGRVGGVGRGITNGNNGHNKGNRNGKVRIATPSIPIKHAIGETTTGTHAIVTQTRYIKATPVKPSTDSRPTLNGADGVSKVAVAGISIGCALAGALIAALVVFGIMRRRRRRHTSTATGEGNSWQLGDRPAVSSNSSWYSRGQEKMPVGMAVPVSRNSSSPDLQQLLPQPIEHKHISSELSALRALIRNHLINYYRTAAIEPYAFEAAVDQNALAEIARDTPFSAKAWIELLASTQARSNAVRFLIAWVLFNRIDLDCDAVKTLLPPGIAASFTHMSSIRGREADTEYLQSRWRAISGLLTKGQYEQRGFDGSDDRWQNLLSTVRLLDGVLKPLAVEALNKQRLESLTDIMKRGAAFGFTLASQPSSWIFDWDATGASGRSAPLVLFPSLSQQTNDQGRRCQDHSLELGDKELANSILVQ